MGPRQPCLLNSTSTSQLTGKDNPQEKQTLPGYSGCGVRAASWTNDGPCAHVPAQHGPGGLQGGSTSCVSTVTAGTRAAALALPGTGAHPQQEAFSRHRCGTTVSPETLQRRAARSASELPLVPWDACWAPPRHFHCPLNCSGNPRGHLTHTADGASGERATPASGQLHETPSTPSGPGVKPALQILGTVVTLGPQQSQPPIPGNPRPPGRHCAALKQAAQWESQGALPNKLLLSQ